MSEIVQVSETHKPIVIETSILSDDEIGRVWRIAKSLAASGMFKDVTQAEQAFGRILLGRDLGLTPAQSLMSLDVVEGNVQIRAVLLASWVRKHPDYDYKVTEHDDQHCVIEFWYRGEIEGTSAFSMEDAKRAHLVKEHPRSPWKAHPRNMVFARAMSNGVRWYCPDLTGGIPVYTEADSFEQRALGAGEGDGSEPGWSGLSVIQVAAIERMLERATELGHAGLSDRATVQMRLASQTPAYVDSWLAGAAAELEKLAAKIPDADVVPSDKTSSGGMVSGESPEQPLRAHETPPLEDASAQQELDS